MTISCLCVTQSSRVHLLEKALESFAKQSFPESKRELVMVHHEGDHFTDRLEDLLDKYHIRNYVVSSSEARPLGELRAISINTASGDLLCQWDDDDIYHSERLVAQSEPFGKIDIVATTLALQMFWFPLAKELYIRRGGKEGIHGSIMFSRTVSSRYPATLSKGEDTVFINDLLAQHPNQICRLDDRPELYLRRVHGNNTWDAAHHRSQVAQALDRDWLLQRKTDIIDWLASYGISDLEVCDLDGHVFAIPE